MLFLFNINGRNHNLSQWLTHLDVYLTTQGKGHRGNLLCHTHSDFEVGINGLLVSYWEIVEMHAFQFASQVMIEFVGIERGKRSQQFRHRHQAGIKRLISRKLVFAHLCAPETFTVQTHIPVAQIVVDKGVYQSTGTCGVKVFQFALNTLYQRVGFGNYPTVNLRTLFKCHLLCLGIKAVDISIECKETIRII